MMNCVICGVEVLPKAAYCHACGAKVAALDIAAEASETPDAADPSSAPVERVRQRQTEARSADLAERDIWQGRYCAKAMAGPFLLAGAASIGLLAAGAFLELPDVPRLWRWLSVLALILVLWLALACQYLYRRYSVWYRLTSQRFYHDMGFLRKVTNRIEVIDMDDVTTVQGLIDRFFGVGSVKITSSDRTHPELWLTGIDNVRDVAAKLDAARRAERVRRGLHIESI